MYGEGSNRGSSQAREMVDLFKKIFNAPIGENTDVPSLPMSPPSTDISWAGANPDLNGNYNGGNIVIVGIGGCGSNTIHNLNKLQVEGVKLVAVNTDKIHLDGVNAPIKILIGESITHGLGAGGRPEVARACAEQDAHKISDALGNRPDLVFIAAGMGGGTGTGAAPVVAKIAKDKGARVIGFVTLPFKTEGRHKYKIAQEGIRQLRKWADTVVLISNDRLLQLAGDLPIDQAFVMADYTLAVMVKGIAEIIRKRTMVNVDLNDIRMLMSAGGVAAVGIGESSDPKRRAEEAVKMALRNQLIDISPDGARGALVVVYGGKNLKLTEVHQITGIVASRMSSDAIIKIGADMNEQLGDTVRVILLLTGIKSPDVLGPERLHDVSMDIPVMPLDGGSRFGGSVEDILTEVLGQSMVLSWY